MTIPQFLQYLAHQPWEFQYIVNFLSSPQFSPHESIHHPISGAFSWSTTPEGWEFWRDIELQTSRLADPTIYFTYHELQAALRDIYFESIPELFI